MTNDEPPLCLPCSLGDCDSCPAKLQQRGLPGIEHWKACRCDEDSHPRRVGSRFGQDGERGGGSVPIVARKNVIRKLPRNPWL